MGWWIILPLNATVKAHLLMAARKFAIFDGEKVNQPEAVKKLAATLFQRAIPSSPYQFQELAAGRLETMWYGTRLSFSK